MRLKKKQKELVIKLIAAGLQTDEINQQAAEFKYPFHVSRSQVAYYRETREQDINAIRKLDENKALIEGYSQVQHRVHKLSMLAALMEKDLLGGFMWLDQVKSIGSGEDSEKVEYEEFNTSEISQYRGVLDDIAKETGGRIMNTRNIDLDLTQLTNDQLNRLAQGEDVLSVLLNSGEG